MPPGIRICWKMPQHESRIPVLPEPTGGARKQPRERALAGPIPNARHPGEILSEHRRLRRQSEPGAFRLGFPKLLIEPKSHRNPVGSGRLTLVGSLTHFLPGNQTSISLLALDFSFQALAYCCAPGWNNWALTSSGHIIN